MGFDSGSVTFRMFYLPGGLPLDAVERFAKHALPPINTLSREEISGWVTGRHMLDRDINDGSAFQAGYLYLNLVKAERKIPPALLKAECAMEELALMQAEGKDKLNRSERSAIKKEVSERLLPGMPPSLTGIPIVYDKSARMLFAGATTEKQTDALTIQLQGALGTAPVPVTADTAALKIAKLDTGTMLDPTSFSPELEDPLAGCVIGHDFLTWLWFYSEARGGTLTVDGDQYGVMIEGPLTFFLEGDGAHVTLLRKGSPLVSTEAKTALMSGKKLTSAKITMGRSAEQWTATVDASEFIFRGLKIPKSEELDAISWFQQRMISLRRFQKAFLTFYEKFLSERTNPEVWVETQKDIHKWVSGREAKK